MVAGPCSTAPVRALNIEPWHGQLSVVAAANATAQPWCVQTVLNATTLPAVGCATMISAPPASLAGTAPPTGTLLSATIAFAAGAAAAADEEVAAAEVDVVAEVGAAVDAAVGAVDDAADDGADVGATAEAADDCAEAAAAEDVAGDDAADEAEDGAAVDDATADGVVLLAAAVLELPHAASVSAPAPRPAATSACRRFGSERSVSLRPAESAVGSASVRGW